MTSPIAAFIQFNYIHPCESWVTAADYVSVSLCKTPILISANEIAHIECGQSSLI